MGDASYLCSALETKLLHGKLYVLAKDSKIHDKKTSAYLLAKFLFVEKFGVQ